MIEPILGTRVMHQAILTAFLCTPLVLAGCASSPADTAPLSGAASMRIDVEVYKGPLSKEKPVQEAELSAKVKDGRRAFTFLAQDIATSMCRIGCFEEEFNASAEQRRIERMRRRGYPDTQPEYPPGNVTDMQRRWGFDYMATVRTDPHSECEPPSFPWRIAPRGIDDPKYKVCPLLDRLYTDSHVFADALDSFDKAPLSGASPEARLVAASKLAEELHSRASFWAGTHTSLAPLEPRVRVAVANFAHFAADYGNQIGSRADTLYKLEKGVDGLRVWRDQLANSTYLRDSAPTAYLNLFVHNNAAVLRSNETALDRVRMVEQLVADTHWARVNTVFAAGQGETTMAFVKDDIGNWNLKNFDNLPGELVNAYKSAGLAIVKAVGDVAKSAASGGATAGVSQALALADQVALGSRPPTEVTDAVLGFNAKLRDQITSIGRAQRDRLAALDGKIATSKANVARQQQLLEAANTNLATAQGQLDALAEARAKDEQTLTRWRSEEQLLQNLIAAPPGGGTSTAELRQRLSDAERERKSAEIVLTASKADERAKIVDRDNLRGQQRQNQSELDKLVDADLALAAERATLLRETARLMQIAIRQHSGVIDQLQATPALQR